MSKFTLESLKALSDRNHKEHKGSWKTVYDIIERTAKTILKGKELSDELEDIVQKVAHNFYKGEAIENIRKNLKNNEKNLDINIYFYLKKAVFREIKGVLKSKLNEQKSVVSYERVSHRDPLNNESSYSADTILLEKIDSFLQEELFLRDPSEVLEEKIEREKFLKEVKNRWYTVLEIISKYLSKRNPRKNSAPYLQTIVLYEIIENISFLEKISPYKDIDFRDFLRIPNEIMNLQIPSNPPIAVGYIYSQLLLINGPLKKQDIADIIHKKDPKFPRNNLDQWYHRAKEKIVSQVKTPEIAELLKKVFPYWFRGKKDR